MVSDVHSIVLVVTSDPPPPSNPPPLPHMLLVSGIFLKSPTLLSDQLLWDANRRWSF
jgi:hypothetical protein